MQKPETSESPGRSQSPLVALGRGLWKSLVHLALVLGWIACALFVFLWVLEESGWIRRRVEARLAVALAPLTSSIQLGAVDLRWGAREVVLRDLTLEAEGEDLHVDRLSLRLGWREPEGLRVERAAVEGASVLLSRELLTRVRSLRADADGKEPELARLILRDVQLALRTPRGKVLPLGLLSAAVEPEGTGGARVAGQLRGIGAEAEAAGELAVRGSFDPSGALELDGTARSLRLDPWLEEAVAQLLPGRELALGGLLDLDLHARYPVNSSPVPALELRLRLRDGHVRLPTATLEAAELAAEARYEPSGSASDTLYDRRSWSARAELDARWRDVAIAAGLRLSDERRPAGTLEAWTELHGLPLDDATLAAAGRPQLLVDDLFPWLAPSGATDVYGAAVLDGSWDGETPLESAIEACVCVRPEGAASAAYHGPELRGASLGEGFPLRLEAIRGAVVFAWAPGAAYANQLGIVGIEGESPTGRARVDGTWHRVPREQRGAVRRVAARSLWLRIGSDALAVDEALERGACGLAGVVPPTDLWDLFEPLSGELGFDLELWSNEEAPRTAARLAIDLRALAARPAPFPLLAHDVSGAVQVEVDGRDGESGGGVDVRFDAVALSPSTAEPVRVRGFLQRLGRGEGRPMLAEWHVEARAVELVTPELWRALAAVVPDETERAAATRPKGRVALSLRSTRLPSEQEGLLRLDVWPESRIQLSLPALDLPLELERGRASLTIPLREDRAGPEGVSGRLFVPELEGRVLVGSRRLASRLSGELAPDGALRAEIAVQGIDSTDAAVLALARERFGLEGLGAGGESTLLMRGRLDLHARVEAEPAGRPGFALDLWPRRMELGPRTAPLLRGIEGRMVFEAGELRAERVRARLARTPVELADLLVRSGSEEELELSARLSASGLPLDQEHLSRFVPSDPLRAWIDDLRWRGRVDVAGARCQATFGAGGLTRLSFAGDLALADLYVQLGVPVAVRSASARQVELAYEKGSLRAWGKIESLYAQMDGRRLDDASMVASFVQPRLTIEDFHGRFEEGELSSLGWRAGTGGAFLALDLVPPYPFGLSIEMREVDVGGLLRGLFQSDFANQGRLRASLRLNGDTAHLLALRGQGFAELANSSLWSIPVFQALFSQLGLDSTATFDEMRTSFTVEKGAIQMRNMRVKSPLLNLLGEGTLGLDGSLSHQLEVRYSLVDRLGPITALLYKIQKSLLHVAIRGNMERPRVELKGLLPVFFPGGGAERSLPLPSLSDLPARF